MVPSSSLRSRSGIVCWLTPIRVASSEPDIPGGIPNRAYPPFVWDSLMSQWPKLFETGIESAASPPVK